MIKLLIVDNHPIIRKGFEALFSESSEIKIVGTLGDGESVLEFVKDNPVDIIITEIDFPKLNGLSLMRFLRTDFPEIKVIVFSAQSEDVYAINTLKGGACAFLHKSTNPNIIRDAIIKVYNGGIYLSDSLTEQLAFGARNNKDGAYYRKLSTREAEVLKLLTIGKKNKEISKELDINEKTVSTYKARLMTKLKVTNLVDLINQTKANQEYL